MLSPQQGLVPTLLQEILSVFPLDSILTPPELASRYDSHWPSMAQLMADGKRLMVVSLSDYGEEMADVVFARGLPVCRWLEPELVDLQVAPACAVTHPKSGRVEPMHAGRIFRTMTCELMYGPLNCDFVYHGVNAPLLDEYALPQVVACGLNVPSPDLLTPERSAAGVWTWAPGHPYDAASGKDVPVPAATWWRPLRQTDQSMLAWLAHSAKLLLRMLTGLVAVDASCSAMRARDGRWVAVPCDAGHPTACRRGGENGTTGTWVLHDGTGVI